MEASFLLSSLNQKCGSLILRFRLYRLIIVLWQTLKIDYYETNHFISLTIVFLHF